MKTLLLFSLSLTVALGMPPFALDVAQKPVLVKEDQKPVLGDWLPVQGHVVVEDPLPQVKQEEKKEQAKMAPGAAKEEQSVMEKEVKKEKPEVKVEEMGQDTTEVQMEQQVKEKQEVKPEQEAKVELKVEMEQEKTAAMKEEVKAEVEPAVKMEPEVMSEPEVQVKPAVEVEEVKEEVEPEVKMEPEVMSEPEVQVQPVVEVEEVKEEVGPEVKMEPEVMSEPEEQVQPAVEVEEVKEEVEPEDELQDEFGVQMDLLPETEAGLEADEEHTDFEGQFEMFEEPLMELEPLDDDKVVEKEQSDAEQTEKENSPRAAFQNLPVQDEEGFVKESDALFDEPIMELEPEEGEEAPQYAMPGAENMEEGPLLDFMGDPVKPFDEYFPNEEARMGMDDGFPAEEPDYMMMEEPGSEFKEEMSKQRSFSLAQDNQATRQSYCSGLLLGETCYLFFQEQKRAADAEFYCQDSFPGGHLASVTSQNIHREVIELMLQENGTLTDSWIGGLRYLDTGRFIWLDGSQWDYSDWLSGEPSNNAEEECVKMAALGKGKFSGSTCSEPQSFICSFPFQ
ncbi:probable inactive protein kinase DDB_G0270444 [Notolabrus celidotus]|uniref:probable inactive protein kinase DDB_G0270444 n=1 Tax=Notolabrus celidotus TaxID=1203425 RepID=UPI0014902F7D|nr:probable inactive protein kinase DDB_G0270444 [Notolabrus celidotus]